MQSIISIYKYLHTTDGQIYKSASTLRFYYKQKASIIVFNMSTWKTAQVAEILQILLPLKLNFYKIHVGIVISY